MKKIRYILNKFIVFYKNYVKFLLKKDLRFKWNFYVKKWDSLFRGSAYVSPYAKIFLDYCIMFISLLYVSCCFIMFYFVIQDFVNFVIDFYNTNIITKESVPITPPKETPEIVNKIIKGDLESSYNEYDKIKKVSLQKDEDITKDLPFSRLISIGFVVLAVVAGITIVIIRIYGKKD
jgi:hypothetical protein